MSGGPGRTICFKYITYNNDVPPFTSFRLVSNLQSSSPVSRVLDYRCALSHLTPYEWTFASLHRFSLFREGSWNTSFGTGPPRCSAFTCKPFLLEVWLLPNSWWDCQELALWAREMTVGSWGEATVSQEASLEHSLFPPKSWGSNTALGRVCRPLS